MFVCVCVCVFDYYATRTKLTEIFISIFFYYSCSSSSFFYSPLSFSTVNLLYLYFKYSQRMFFVYLLYNNIINNCKGNKKSRGQ